MFSKKLFGLFPEKVLDGGTGLPYMHRFYILNTSNFGIYLHKIVREDPDPRLHSHPWKWAIVIILLGGYGEQRPVEDVSKCVIYRRPGSCYRLSSETMHRIESVTEGGSWSLFIRGRRIAEWGFGSRSKC